MSEENPSPQSKAIDPTPKNTTFTFLVGVKQGNTIIKFEETDAKAAIAEEWLIQKGFLTRGKFQKVSEPDSEFIQFSRPN
jgi:hypothetical protein